MQTRLSCFPSLVLFALILLTACGPQATPIPTAVPPTETPIPPTSTPLPPTETSTPTVIPTPTLGTGSTMAGKDGMTLLYVAAGEFLMGSKEKDVSSQQDEMPQRSVTLDAFWMDETEVTNKQYRSCIEAGVCRKPQLVSNWATYPSNPKYENYPVLFVTWQDAKTYCEWVGRRLPTEAEWEKAARGTDGRIYPWGDDGPTNDLLNYNEKLNFPAAVKSYPSGVSPYGIYDMAGNVWEWVSDWYAFDYYKNAPLSNPLGPEAGKKHILRGGSYNSGADLIRAANRLDPFISQKGFNDAGFRCALSVSP